MTAARTLDGGRIVAGEVLESGAGSARLRGHLVFDELQRRLVTLGRRQSVSHAELRRALAMEIDGITPLDYIGPVDAGGDEGWTGDAMVEVEPRGVRADESVPLTEAEGVALALEILDVIGRAHERGVLVRGIRPELIYCHAGPGGAARLVALAPRAQLFLMTAQPASSGVPILSDLYLAPEDIFQLAPQPRSDVFALCAALFFLTSGVHPFGDHPSVQMGRVMAGTIEPHPGSSRLRTALTAGLGADPARRPEPAALARALRTL